TRMEESWRASSPSIRWSSGCRDRRDVGRWRQGEGEQTRRVDHPRPACQESKLRLNFLAGNQRVLPAALTTRTTWTTLDHQEFGTRNSPISSGIPGAEYRRLPAIANEKRGTMRVLDYRTTNKWGSGGRGLSRGRCAASLRFTGCSGRVKSGALQSACCRQAGTSAHG